MTADEYRAEKKRKVLRVAVGLFVLTIAWKALRSVLMRWRGRPSVPALGASEAALATTQGYLRGIPPSVPTTAAHTQYSKASNSAMSWWRLLLSTAATGVGVAMGVRMAARRDSQSTARPNRRTRRRQRPDSLRYVAEREHERLSSSSSLSSIASADQCIVEEQPPRWHRCADSNDQLTAPSSPSTTVSSHTGTVDARGALLNDTVYGSDSEADSVTGSPAITRQLDTGALLRAIASSSAHSKKSSSSSNALHSSRSIQDY